MSKVEVSNKAGKDGKHRDEEWLRKEIEGKNRSIKEIARDDVPVVESILRRWLDRFGIQKPLQSKEILQREFIEKDKSIEELMEQWNADKYEIVIALESNGVI